MNNYSQTDIQQCLKSFSDASNHLNSLAAQLSRAAQNGIQSGEYLWKAHDSALRRLQKITDDLQELLEDLESNS